MLGRQTLVRKHCSSRRRSARLSGAPEIQTTDGHARPRVSDAFDVTEMKLGSKAEANLKNVANIPLPKLIVCNPKLIRIKLIKPCMVTCTRFESASQHKNLYDSMSAVKAGAIS
ncbi:hypothetical protein PIIN_03973 [Serendipita indica DSM 11827]|uniref:Uncharacterized protein n=1 Tax=Serendipita indica (strain DSM 11827) TaxID=1109443 RepID=G4TFD3_SERID|nr:hypothetical protein PIIN_03973 [Serendipita indica DSM 11827]